MLKKIKGQSTLEYVVILTAIVAAVIIGAGLIGTKSADSGLGKLMHQAGESIKGASTRAKGVIPTQ